MKRLCALVLCLLLLTACGQSTSTKPSVEPTTESATESTEQSTKPTESITEQSTESSTEPTEQPTESTTESTEQPAESTTEATTSDTDKEETQMLHIQAGESEFTATWADNSSVDALKELLAEGPLTLTMSDYAQMEKGADLGVRLPQNNQQMNTTAGDIILYQGRTLVIYYDQNSWSLTPIAKIEGVDAEKLRAALGDGDVTVTFSLE